MKGFIKHWQAVQWPEALLGLAFLLVLIPLNYLLEQDQFPKILASYSLLFGIYFLVLKKGQLHFWISIAFLARISLLFAFPNLSDDIYRFIWDGYLNNLGFNPFAEIPSYYIDQQIAPAYLSPELYQKLNSPHYHSVYPPFAQGIFSTATYLAGQNWLAVSTLIKALILIAETGTIILIYRLLKSYRIHPRNLLIYALNPLIIIELSGNVHFEAFLIVFFFLALQALLRHKPFQAALFMGLSISSKLITLIPQIFLIRRFSIKKLLLYGLALLLVLGISFSPFLSADFLFNMTDSLDLYFRNFEFNASIYYLLDWIIKLKFGYGMIHYIGPILSLITLLACIILAIRDRSTDVLGLIQISFWAFCIYLIGSTTVHPWYLALPIALSVFTSYRFILIWSALACLSYIKYSDYEHLYFVVIIIEYLIVFGYMIWEITQHRSKIKNRPSF